MLQLDQSTWYLVLELLAMLFISFLCLMPLMVLGFLRAPQVYIICGLAISATMAATCLLSVQAPQTVECVDRSGFHGVVLLTQNLAIKLVKLAFLVTRKVPITAASGRSLVPAAAYVPPTDILFTDEPLKFHGEVSD